MSRINAILVLILAFSSICFGATLMQMSMPRSNIDNKEKAYDLRMSRSGQSCEQMVKDCQRSMRPKIALELYKQAFSLSFNGDWQAAKFTSECASQLINGSNRWDIEAKDLVN